TSLQPVGDSSLQPPAPAVQPLLPTSALPLLPLSVPPQPARLEMGATSASLALLNSPAKDASLPPPAGQEAEGRPESVDRLLSLAAQ
ncbi:Hypothetical predicted protein, partial [Marmota monax]